MNYEQWKQEWLALGNEMAIAANIGLEQYLLAPETKEILCQHGIPLAIGELDFTHIQSPPLLTINRLFLQNDPFYERFLRVGETKSGDALALNATSQEVVYLNRNSNYQEELINTSFLHLLPTATLIDRFMRQMTSISEEEDVKTEFSNDAFHALKKDLMLVDPDAMLKKNSYWNCLLESFLWDRDEERRAFG